MSKKPSAKKSEDKPKEIPHSAMEQAVNKEAPKRDDEFSRLSQLPEEAQKRLKAIKESVEELKKRILAKFDKYVMAIALLPPPKPQQPQPGMPPPSPIDPNKIGVLILIDDADSKKMAKAELATKLQAIFTQTASEIDKNLAPEVLLVSELWQNLYDSKYEILQSLAMSAPIFDKGMLAAIKITEVHRSMVLKKFERYIVSYVLAGSLVQGRATDKSDIDVFIVIDDTDVKRMTRLELKDKLRAIIIGMGIEAGDITGVRNKINIQVYILTEFWDSIREANPIIFTFLRDGVPLYDRGIFMPWKHLLRIGKIKPSAEAIELYMSTGDSMLKRVKYKLKEIGMEDTFWAILTPSQAALMMYGVPPPTPKETPEVMREIFVEREKILEDEYVKILEANIKMRKDLEHGELKEVSGKDIDELLSNSEKYLKRIEKLFGEIEARKKKESLQHTYDALESAVRDILRLEGIERLPEDTLLKVFDEELVKSGKIELSLFKSLKAVLGGRAKKRTKSEEEKARTDGEAVLRSLIDHIQRRRGVELNRAKIRVRHQGKFGEVFFLGQEAFIVRDLDAEKKEISRAKVSDHGEFSDFKAVTMEELEKVLAQNPVPPKVFIKERLFENLKGIFGPDVEILVNY